MVRARWHDDSAVWRVQKPVFRRGCASCQQIWTIMECADECVGFLVLGHGRFFSSKEEGESHDEHAQDSDTYGDEFAAARIGHEVGREGVRHRRSLVLAHGDGFSKERQA